jgi:hypothetical protein
MLISPDDPKTQFLCPRVTVVDENGDEVKTVYSFDTETKEAHLFMLNEKHEVRVFEGKPVLQKKTCLGWKVFDKFTKEEVI